MNTINIDWNQRTILYVLSINGMIKFGITSNWSKREKQYIRELKDIEIIKLKEIQFSNRWQAELIEQIMKWRLRRWAVDGRHEWIILPIQTIFDCMYDTIRVIEPEFQIHENIHQKGENRWAYYRQLSETHFKD